MKKKHSLGSLMKRIWERIPSRGCHLGLDGEEPSMMKRFETILDGIAIKGKTIIDYGCGGAILGKYVMENGAEKYYGYDVSKRSLEYAEKRLQEYKKAELNLVVTHDINFAEKKPDILCSIACLLHFPNKSYLDRFLARCNESGAKYVILEIRNQHIGTVFQEKQYNSFNSVIMACRTDPEYISSGLSNYKIYKETDPDKAPTSCQLLWYKKINRKEKDDNNSAA